MNFNSKICVGRVAVLGLLFIASGNAFANEQNPDRCSARTATFKILYKIVADSGSNRAVER